MRLEEVKKLYPDEWIAFRSNEDGENSDGKVLLHNKKGLINENSVLYRSRYGITTYL
jgi:hypothetical protein